MCFVIYTVDSRNIISVTVHVPTGSGCPDLVYDYTNQPQAVRSYGGVG